MINYNEEGPLLKDLIKVLVVISVLVLTGWLTLVYVSQELPYPYEQREAAAKTLQD